ncbi:hypothetical protein WA026_012130 [Henosepilachna vigintioctopunctata]|uniref:Uncharacterized protein n=1 Tax=Henosepilachna vigintioctopunctata TaxID=420089 RepID=A0AAW1V515_9CUCU
MNQNKNSKSEEVLKVEDKKNANTTDASTPTTSPEPYTGSHKIEETSRSEDTGAEDRMKALDKKNANTKDTSTPTTSHVSYTGSHRIEGTSRSEDSEAEDHKKALVSSMARAGMHICMFQKIHQL